MNQVLGLEWRRMRLWREVALLAAIAMELSWITPWFLGLMDFLQPVSALDSVVVIAGLSYATFLSLRLLVFLRFSRQVRYFVLLLVLASSGVSANALLLHPGEAGGLQTSISQIMQGFQSLESILPPEVVLLITLSLAWLRALRWGGSEGTPTELRNSLRFSFWMLILFVLAFVWRGEGQLHGFAYLFFFAALIGSGTARIARSYEHPATQSNPSDRNWQLMLWGVFALSGLLVTGLGWALNTNLEWFRQTALFLWLLFWGVVLLILSPVLVVGVAVLEWLAARVDLEMLNRLFPATDLMEEPEKASELAEGAGSSFLELLQAWLASLPIAHILTAARPYFFWVIILLLIGLGIFLAGRRISLWKALGEDLTPQSSMDDDEWLQGLRKNWSRRLQGLRDNLLRIANLDQGRKILAAARIRRVYSFLMELSKSLGKERDKAMTPMEFLPTLEGLFPLHAEEIALITEAYVRVRYGEIDESPSEVVDVDRAWLQLRLEGQRIKRKRRQARRKGANFEQSS